MKTFARSVTTILLLYLLVCIAARVVSPKLMFPAPAPTYGETLTGLSRIKGADEREFAAVHLPNPKAKRLLVFFHGNGEDLGINSARLEEFRTAGYAVLAVDYPGYGLTGGAPSEDGVYAAADAAYRHATGALGWAPEKITVYGLSLGGGAATWLASREKVGGLILECTFTSIYRVMTRWPLLLGDRMTSLSRIRRVTCPVLVMHGMEDAVIPFSHGPALSDAVRSPKRSLWVEGANHCEIPVVARDRYWTELRAFEELLSK